jgi:hypothetical protein
MWISLSHSLTHSLTQTHKLYTHYGASMPLQAHSITHALTHSLTHLVSFFESGHVVVLLFSLVNSGAVAEALPHSLTYSLTRSHTPPFTPPTPQPHTSLNPASTAPPPALRLLRPPCRLTACRRPLTPHVRPRPARPEFRI